jgi:quinolinate synthase
MKLNTLEKLYACLKNNQPEIKVDSAILDRSRLPIVKMLEISEKLGL